MYVLLYTCKKEEMEMILWCDVLWINIITPALKGNLLSKLTKPYFMHDIV